MAFFRTVKKDNPYVQVEKTFIEDDSLSWGAKGLMVYLLSRPEDWKVMRADLEKRSIDKRTKVENYIYELMAAGYIYYYAIRDSVTNQIEEWVYEVYESPEYNSNLEESIAKGKEMIQNAKDRNKKKVAKRKEKEKSPDVEIPQVDEKPKKPDVEVPDVEVPHVEIPHYNNNNRTKNDFNKNKDIKDLSIQEDIFNSNLPLDLKKLLAGKIDRLIALKITVLDIVNNYKLHKDNVTEGQYISALEFALELTKFTKSFKDVMAANVSKQLDFAKVNAEAKSQGVSKPRKIREEMLPSWFKGKSVKEDAPKEEVNADFEEEKRKLAQELKELDQELKAKNNEPKQPTAEEIAQAQFEVEKAELAKKLSMYNKSVLVK